MSLRCSRVEDLQARCRRPRHPSGPGSTTTPGPRHPDDQRGEHVRGRSLNRWSHVVGGFWNPTRPTATEAPEPADPRRHSGLSGLPTHNEHRKQTDQTGQCGINYSRTRGFGSDQRLRRSRRRGHSPQPAQHDRPLSAYSTCAWRRAVELRIRSLSTLIASRLRAGARAGLRRTLGDHPEGEIPQLAVGAPVPAGVPQVVDQQVDRDPQDHPGDRL